MIHIAENKTNIDKFNKLVNNEEIDRRVKKVVHKRMNRAMLNIVVCLLLVFEVTWACNRCNVYFTWSLWDYMSFGTTAVALILSMSYIKDLWYYSSYLKKNYDAYKIEIQTTKHHNRTFAFAVNTNKEYLTFKKSRLLIEIEGRYAPEDGDGILVYFKNKRNKIKYIFMLKEVS